MLRETDCRDFYPVDVQEYPVTANKGLKSEGMDRESARLRRVVRLIYNSDEVGLRRDSFPHVLIVS